MTATAETTEPVDDIAAEVDSKGVAVRTIKELSETAYRARPEHSVSEIKLVPDEPELYWGRYIAKLEEYQVTITPQIARGTAIHEAVLQGIPPKIIPRDVLSKSGARQGNTWKDFAEEHAGEVWLKEDEAEPLKRAIESIHNHKQARAILEQPGECELSIFRRDEYTGLPLKHRLDKLAKAGGGIVVDLKSANDPTELGFPFACLDRKYHIQAAAYFEAAEEATGQTPEAFMFIAVQVEPPYICEVHQCTEEMMQFGFTKWREALQDLDIRLKSGDWHRPTHGHINRLNLPRRAYQQF